MTVDYGVITKGWSGKAAGQKGQSDTCLENPTDGGERLEEEGQCM